VRETSFRRKLEAAYPTKIGVNGILSNRDFTQALLKALDEDTLQRLVDRLPRPSPPPPPPATGAGNYQCSFHASGAAHKKYLASATAPPGLTSDELPVVLATNLSLQRLTFANSNSSANCTFYFYQNLTEGTCEPALEEALYSWTIPNQRTAHYTLPTPVAWQAGDRVTVFCVDAHRTALNVCIELYFA